MLSNLNFIKVAGSGPVEKAPDAACWPCARRFLNIQSLMFPPGHLETCKQTLLLYLCRPRKTVRCTPHPIPHPPGKYQSGV